MINNRQKAQLRALANQLNTIGQIGKDGISNNLISFLDDALEAHELIKINTLKTCPISLNEIAIDLASVLHCQVVQKIGRVLILYRCSSENKRIKLVK
ncbi:MAG: YhbY family RNA-binding protein [Erysipelotrichaceae bacterium]